MSQREPLVSVIVPTYNSEKHIARCLASIKEQSYPAIELIVVDNHSTDRTHDIAARFTEKVFVRGPERCSQRNYGFEQSSGDLVAFIDSDMTLSPRVIAEAVGKCTNTKNVCDGIYIPEVSVGTGFWTACKALEKSCYAGDATIEAARFFRRDVFQYVSGYDENLVSAEDWDLSQRIAAKGYRLGHIDARIEHDEGHLSIMKTIRKKYYYGQKIQKYMQKHPDRLSAQFTPLRPAFLRHWRRLIKSPLLSAGFVFMKLCEFSAGGLGFAKAALFNSFRTRV